MIKFIPADTTLSLRSEMLRDNAEPYLCRFDGDDASSSFHLGFFHEDHLISVATFHKKDCEGFSGIGFQLRGMVTSPEFQGRGFGNQLLNFAIVYLRGQKVNYLWCNARKVAYRFYLGTGFEFISDEFEVENIGLHRIMYLKISS